MTWDKWPVQSSSLSGVHFFREACPDNWALPTIKGYLTIKSSKQSDVNSPQDRNISDLPDKAAKAL